MKKRITFLLCFLFLCIGQVAFAQRNRPVIVRFQNGNTLKGEISRLPTDGRLRLKTPNGNIVLFQPNEARSITYEDGSRVTNIPLAPQQAQPNAHNRPIGQQQGNPNQQARQVGPQQNRPNQQDRQSRNSENASVPSQGMLLLNKASGKGLYIRLGAGYSLGAGATSGSKGMGIPEYSTVSTYRSDSKLKDSSTTYEHSSNTTQANAPISIGQGINMMFAIGYMLNKNIGLELSGIYLLGGDNVLENVNTSDYNDSYSLYSYIHKKDKYGSSSRSTSTKEAYNLKRSSLTIIPALRVVAPINDKFSFYSRLGVLLPISDDLVYEYNRDYSNKQYSNDNIDGTKSVNESTNERRTINFTSYINLGYNASIGINRSFGKHLDLFGEINVTTNSYEVRRGEITEWTKTSNSANGHTSNNLLKDLDVCDKITEYQRPYTEKSSSSNSSGSNSNSKDWPTKAVSFSLPASSIGISMGLAFKF